MKTPLLLSVLMLGLMLGVYGQKPTITLTFTADKNGQYVPLNSILIENLTRGVDTTLYIHDTVLVIDYLVGMNENLSTGGSGFYLSQNYPNPFGGETTIDLFLPETENVLIIVSDMLGRELLTRNYRMGRGSHSFSFYPGTESLYFLTARSDNQSQTIKMINTTHDSKQEICALEYTGMKYGFNKYKAGNEETNFVYYLGDLLKFTAFADEGERVIADSPTENQSYVFYFGGVPCPNAPTVTDVDGNVYRTVLIGDQCWMAENLKVGTMINGDQVMTDNGIIEKYCYDNDTANCDIYGGLYQWDEMMNYSSSPGANGICPDGWHMPTDAEWTQLVDYAVAQGFPNLMGNPKGAGNALKSCRQIDSPFASECNTTIHPRWNSHVLHHGFDEFGFSAFPGGGLYDSPSFGNLGNFGGWWSSTEESSANAWYRSMGYLGAAVPRWNPNKLNGFSVRCIKSPTSFTLQLESKPTGIATITGEGHYEIGEQINVAAEANPGWEFVNWKEEDVIISTEASFIFTMPDRDITLTANFIQDPNNFECGIGTTADVDGNIYYTVLIGNQCWFKENLQTAKYSNGTPIEYPGTDNNAWSNNTSGAYAWYNNDLSWKKKYGALYNWHAVNNSNGLCPVGWHVPSDAEWTVLVDYVIAQGYPNNNYNNPDGAGNALKSCRQVNSPVGGDCNTSEHPRWNSHTIHIGFDTFDFSALPGGRRLVNGNPYSMGSVGYWWSSTELSNIDAWGRLIIDSYGTIERWNHFNKITGFSVRCIRNLE